MLLYHAIALHDADIPLVATHAAPGLAAETVEVLKVTDATLQLDGGPGNNQSTKEVCYTEIDLTSLASGRLEEIPLENGDISVHLPDDDDPVAILLSIGYSEERIAELAQQSIATGKE